MSNEVKGLHALVALADSDKEVQEFLGYLAVHLIERDYPDYSSQEQISCRVCDNLLGVELHNYEPTPPQLLGQIHHDPGCIGELLAIVAGYKNGSYSR